MHPENIRHRITCCRSFQLCPVFIPSCCLYLNFHIRMLFHIGFCQFFHTCFLTCVPDLKNKLSISAGFISTGSACCKPHCKSTCHYKCCYFSHILSLHDNLPYFLFTLITGQIIFSLYIRYYNIS